MAESSVKQGRKSALDPVDRLSEVLFGLIMVLTFTGSLSVATAERSDVREMLIGAIGCNIAWGLIDAVMYLMAGMSERGASFQIIRAIQTARSPSGAHDVIRAHLPHIVASELRHEEFERIRTGILQARHEKKPARLTSGDFKAAFVVFLIVVASTFPVVVPFIIIHDAAVAIRVSNAVAVAMLAMIGFGYGKVAGISAWWMAGAMVALGLVLVSVTIALGG